MEAILEILRKNTEYAAFIKSIEKKHIPAMVSGMCDSLYPFFIASALGDTGRKGFVLCADEREAYRLKESLEIFFPNVYVYPARDNVFDNISAYSREWEHDRLKVLISAAEGSYDAIISFPDAASQYTIPKETLSSRTLKIHRGQSITVESIVSALARSGYMRTEIVEGPGQYALRGGIIDIFSPQYRRPLRIDFFGDEVDLIGFFDVISQRRSENIEEVLILPAQEILADDEANERIIAEISGLLEKKKPKEKKHEEILRTELENLRINGVLQAPDKFLSLIYSQKECLLDYIDDALCFVIETRKVRERGRAFDWTLSETIESAVSAGLCRYSTAQVCERSEAFFSRIEKNAVGIDLFLAADKLFDYRSEYTINAKSISSFNISLDVTFDDLDAYSSAGYSVFMLTTTEKSAENLISILDDKGYSCTKFTGALHKGMISVASGGGVQLQGFELLGSGFVLLTDADMYAAGKSGKTRVKYKISKSERIASYADLAEGDLVVHATHGIGRYVCIQNLKTDGISKDYIKIIYADGGILYVPCNQLDLVSKYLGGNETTKLSKMGSSEWKRAKARAKAAAADVAKELIKLYAERQKSVAYAFPVDDEMQDEFEANFEHEETEGQTIAADEIKRDMSKTVPMDRLLCGDVGFGKTEVSLRAIFKCVWNGKQAAMLVPTTILALQHLQTLRSRFRGYPVRIAMLSRFVSKKEQAKILKELASGELDIVVGTHRILQKDIEFRDLGLLVVDEEQRFGVTHKEKIKTIAKNVHTLTLTATPIPRTLNMALTGVRDMSTLEEAPVDRVPVQTYVLEHDEDIVNEAIRKELRRGGQVFYLHNAVESIYAKAQRIADAFPEAVVAVGHGQMDKEQLSDVWASMLRGETDILVCTTIIESGVNVPNANTLIVEDANKMGLSQLHQIRGRVGRASRKAYAFLTFRRGSLISEIAEKRLEAIREFTEFGSGFKIAMRDLELRGAGNILGTEQSGHMEAIGYDLYVKILDEAINAEKGIVTNDKSECTVDIVCDALIPEDYIESSKLRMDVYRKISWIGNDEDRDDLIDEMIDRYGDLPKPVENLIDISMIRSCASECGFRLVEQKGRMLSLYSDKLDMRSAVLLTTLDGFKGKAMISAGGKPHVAFRLSDGDNVLKVAQNILTVYTELSQKQVDKTHSDVL